MDISWLGHACVRLRTRQAAVVMDPAAREAGFDMGRPGADIVTISRRHPRHAHAAGVRGQPIVIDGPGEYEIDGVQLFGLPGPPPDAAADGGGGDPPGRSTAYVVEADGLRLAHAGGGGAPPDAEDAALFSNLDILLIPIGGEDAAPERAARTVRDLEPTIVIPIGYPGPQAQGEGGAALRAFLDAAGLAPGDPLPKLSVRPRQVGEEQRAVLLLPSRA